MLENELKNFWQNSAENIKFNAERLTNTYLLEKKINKLDANLNIRNWRETIVAGILMLFFFKDLFFSNFTLLPKVGIVLNILGIGFIIWKMWDVRFKKPRINADIPIIEELKQLQSYFILELKMNKTVFVWYLLPLLPGYLFFMIGMAPFRTPLHTIIGFVIGILIFVLVWWLNVRKAPKAYLPILQDIDEQIKAWEE